jgi:Putative beta barrel porin-7 (BBP7)
MTPAPHMDGPGMAGDGCGCSCVDTCAPCGTCGPCGTRFSCLHGWGGCGACEPDDRYQVWASAEYLMWWQRGQSTPPLVAATPAGVPTSQVGLPGTSIVLYDQTPNYTSSGARFSLGAWLPCFCNNLGIEVNYFFLARQSSTSTFESGGDPQLSRPFITSTGVLASEPFALQNATDLAHGSVTIHDYTQLWGIDTNLRYKLWRGPSCWVDFLFGYRYINLSEGIGITEDRFNQVVFTLPDTIHTREVESFETRNEFNGVQIGLDSEFRLGDRWFLGVNAKMAMGTMYQVVNINGSTTFSNDPFGNGTQPGALLASPTNIGRRTQDRFAIAPEVGVRIGYDLTDHLRIFAGYNFLFLSSVVRPGDQIDLNVNPAFRPASGTTPGFGNFQNPALAGPRVPAVLMNTTNYWAQGLTFGLMYRF